MTNIGAHRVDLMLVSVERQGVLAALLDPVVPIEAFAQGRRIAIEPIGEGGVAPDLARQASQADARIVRIALDLAGGDRPPCHPTVVEEDGIPGILPALVDQSFLRASLVLEIAVAVRLSVALDPFE